MNKPMLMIPGPVDPPEEVLRRCGMTAENERIDFIISITGEFMKKKCAENCK